MKDHLSKPGAEPAVWFPAIRAGTGADVFTIRLAEALDRQGIKAEITWLPHRVEYLPWTIRPPSPPGWATIVHVNSWLHPRFIPTSGLPLVATIHGCHHDPALNPYKRPMQRLYHRFWIRPIESHTLARSDAITAVSHYTMERSKSVYGRQDIVTVLNWVDTDRFHPATRAGPNHPFRLLFVGKLSRRKGMDLMPEIMRRLGPEFELRYTDEPSTFDRAVRLPANMTGLGKISDQTRLISLYQESDALLFPTRLEGLSLSAIEAMACGLPIISSDGSSMPEIVVDNKTGVLCPQDDIDEFVKAARSLYDDLPRWMSMREASRERAIQFFGERRAISAYLDIYRCLAER